MGRPPKYTLEGLKLKLSEYLRECKEQKIVPSKANLLLKLDISRETYKRWKDKGDEFSDTLKEIETMIEDCWVQRLEGNTTTGAIFYLKNAFKEHYKDRQETDITTGGEKLPVLVKFIDGKDKNNRDTD